MNIMLLRIFCLLILFTPLIGNAKVLVGSDLLFSDRYTPLLGNKKIGLITNHTAVNSRIESTQDILKKNQTKYRYTLAALFAPEHGITGSARATEDLEDIYSQGDIPIYSLYGKNRRPTDQMLEGIDLLIYDIQDIGSRSYTYITTLFYVMEAAAKKNIPVLVLDRPNPINGMVVDGPMLEEKWRSIVGYVNVPYCHGMTAAELALYFNSEYKVGCKLEVIPMKGWNRKMSFQDTGLAWLPTSPHVPEAATALYYPMTGIIGELSLVNIGVGYTLPFKVIGAPWIDSGLLAETLNGQKFPGVHFEPFHYKPFYGKFAQEECHGVLIFITDSLNYKPVSTQYLIIGILKSLYPEKFKELANSSSKAKQEMFHKVNGTEEVFRIMMSVRHIVWPLRTLHQKEREAFLKARVKYLLPVYAQH